MGPGLSSNDTINNNDLNEDNIINENNIYFINANEFYLNQLKDKNKDDNIY